MEPTGIGPAIPGGNPEIPSHRRPHMKETNLLIVTLIMKYTMEKQTKNLSKFNAICGLILKQKSAEALYRYCKTCDFASGMV